MTSFGEHRYVVPSTADGFGWDGDFAAAVAGAGAVAEPASPPGAACSSLGHYGRSPLRPGAVAGTLRRRGATLSTSSTVTSAAGMLLYLRRTRHCIWMVRRPDAAYYAHTGLPRTGLPRAQ